MGSTQDDSKPGREEDEPPPPPQGHVQKTGGKSQMIQKEDSGLRRLQPHERVAKDDLEFLVLLLPSPKGWKY